MTYEVLWQLVTTCDNFQHLVTTLRQLATTCDNLEQLGLTRINWNHIILKISITYWTNCKFWKSVTDRRQTEDRRQTDGVSDNASTREACASKKSISNFFNTPYWMIRLIYLYLFKIEISNSNFNLRLNT